MIARKKLGSFEPQLLVSVLLRFDMAHSLESVGYTKVDTLHPVTRLFEL